jgi:uncharacterized protein (TIGR03437 family)
MCTSKWLLALIAISAVSGQGVITTVAGNDAIFADDGKPATSAALAAPNGVAVDAGGNVYIASTVQNMVYKVDTKGVIGIVAGNGLRRYAGDGGPARAASLASPLGVALDRAGNLYIADTGNQVVRRVGTNGIITTVAGSGHYGFGGDGGPAAKALFSAVTGVAIDSSGNLYISDQQNSRIRKVNPEGIISTFAGNGTPGYAGDGGAAVNANLNVPSGLAIDDGGSLYVADWVAVRKIAPDGAISTVAGSSCCGVVADGGPATAAILGGAAAVAVDSTGYLYVAENFGQRIRRVSPQGIITTIAGNGKSAFTGDGGSATQASLSSPSGVAVDANGNVYIGDRDNDRVRRVNGGGSISTIAGQGCPVGDGGAAVSARLDLPRGLATDASGNLYVADADNHRVRRVTPAGVISTVAGTGHAGYSGDGGPATAASLNTPWDVKIASDGSLYIADTLNNVVRKVSPAGAISTYAGGGPLYASGDGGPAAQAYIGSPSSIALDGAGNLYLYDKYLNGVRKVAPSGSISTIAGGGGKSGYSGDGGPATSAVFGSNPLSLLADAGGSVYVSDSGNSRVRRIDSRGIITTFAGNGSQGQSGDGGPAIAAGVSGQYLAQDKSGNVFISTVSSIRVVQPNGIIRTYAGTGSLGFSGDGGPALSAKFYALTGLATDASGNLYAADVNNRRVRLIQAQQSPSIVASQKGLTFIASTGGGVPASQGVSIANGGQGTLNWGVTASTTSGGNWLAATPANGSSQASDAGTLLQISANPAGLAAGDYYGQLQIQAPSAPNSPQSVTVVLSVRAPGTGTGSVVQPSGLLFTAAAGSPNPASQSVTLTTLSNSPVTFIATPSFGGQPWFTLSAVSGSTVSGKAATLQILPSVSGLAAGVYNANVAFAFSDNSQHSVQLLLVVAAGGTNRPNAPGVRTAGCVPGTLLPLFTSLGAGFNLTTGWPSPVELRVVDDCGQPLTRGTVTASFSNADPALPLNSLSDGRWTGTWSAQNASAGVIVTATAQSVDQSLKGSTQLNGSLTRNANPPPAVAEGGVLHAASYQWQGSLAPGSLISIFGSLLAQGPMSATELPLSPTLGGTKVTIAGRPLPLLYVGDTQVNAMIPYDLAINASHQVVVQRGTALSKPEAVSVLSSQSGVFTKDQTGKGAGIVVRAAADGTQSIVAADNPAHAYEALVIYCAGLGDVDPRQVAGQQVPFSPLSSTLESVKVTIGGVDAPVFFAGLTPGFTGLYQVNAYVPTGLTPGDNVPLVITQASRSSPPVLISVR